MSATLPSTSLLPTVALAALLAAVGAVGPSPSSPETVADAQAVDTTFTVVLAGGTVYDGTGASPIVADVGLLEGRITAVGDLSGRPAQQRLDVTGLAVVPGFVDVHSHGANDLLERPAAENYVRQGVTTIFGGQDGRSPYPIGAFLERLESSPAAVNVGLFVGHGTVRGQVMGGVDRRPTADELARMKAMVATAMDEGAFGLSSGLEYAPGMYAATGELVELARPAAAGGGLYISHIRDEGGRLLESVREVIRVAEEAGLPGQVTHHKVVGPQRFGRSRASLQLIDEARERGVDVSSDVYPYAASSTGLTILFPGWSKEGAAEDLAARLRDPATRDSIRASIARHLEAERGGDPSTVVLARCTWDPALDGQSLASLLKARGRSVTVAAAAALATELQAQGGCQVVLHSMSEEDVERIMQHPATMIASDGGIPAFGQGVPHPRSYGTFARVLGRYVRDRGVLSFAEAVHKMTGLPARRLGLADRGCVCEGAVADVAVLDPEAVVDHATFAAPHQYATGVQHVFVAGRAVLMDGEPTGARPGRVLRSTDAP